MQHLIKYESVELERKGEQRQFVWSTNTSVPLLNNQFGGRETPQHNVALKCAQSMGVETEEASFLRQGRGKPQTSSFPPRIHGFHKRG